MAYDRWTAERKADQDRLLRDMADETKSDEEWKEERAAYLKKYEKDDRRHGVSQECDD